LIRPTTLVHVTCILLTFVLTSHAAQGSQMEVATPDEFQNAVETAKPGDQIVIADGRYADWRGTLSCGGTADRPIVVRPATEGGVTFSGKTSLRIGGQHLIVRGLVFDGCDLKTLIVNFVEAKYCRVTECRFLNSNHGSGRAVFTFGNGADDNRVDHCRLLNTTGRSVQVIVGSHAQKHGPPARNRIDHNLFQDVPPLGGNGRETIQIGSNQRDYGMLEPLTIVEHNLFLRCNGEAEIISNKSSRNTYRYNLFKDCRGELVLRGASHCTVQGNRFEGCSGGIRIHGTHHRVVDNVVIDPQGTGIRLGYGASIDLGGIYQAVTHCVVANNTIVNPAREGILIGFNRNREMKGFGTLKFPPRENRFERNIVVGSRAALIEVDRAPENVIVQNILYATGTATVPTPGDDAILADPKFIDASAGDYRRRPGDGPKLGASAEPLESGP
jgi:poly(beta-D-mannuronate) lyase